MCVMIFAICLDDSLSSTSAVSPRDSTLLSAASQPPCPLAA